MRFPPQELMLRGRGQQFTDRQAGRHLGVNHGGRQAGKVQGILKTYEREDTQPGAVRGSVPKNEEGARCVGGWVEVCLASTPDHWMARGGNGSQLKFGHLSPCLKSPNNAAPSRIIQKLQHGMPSLRSGLTWTWLLSCHSVPCRPWGTAAFLLPDPVRAVSSSWECRPCPWCPRHLIDPLAYCLSLVVC